MKSATSEKIKFLRENSKEINLWITEVNKRISELEDSYLAETSTLGNIIKGWDIDGKNQRFRPVGEDKVENTKEKLFSCSSYEIWCEQKALQESDGLKLPIKIDSNKQEVVTATKNNVPKTQKRKRSVPSTMMKKDDPDFGQHGDY